MSDHITRDPRAPNSREKEHLLPEVFSRSFIDDLKPSKRAGRIWPNGSSGVVEHLPSKHEAPSSNPNTTKKKKKGFKSHQKGCLFLTEHKLHLKPTKSKPTKNYGQLVLHFILTVPL
jgi:hypothetical protein